MLFSYFFKVPCSLGEYFINCITSITSFIRLLSLAISFRHRYTQCARHYTKIADLFSFPNILTTTPMES